MDRFDWLGQPAIPYCLYTCPFKIEDKAVDKCERLTYVKKKSNPATNGYITVYSLKQGYFNILQDAINGTVDGRNPASPGMYRTL